VEPVFWALLTGISVLVAVLLSVGNNQNRQIINWHRKKWEKPRRDLDHGNFDSSTFYDPLAGVVDGDENQPLDLTGDTPEEEN